MTEELKQKAEKRAIDMWGNDEAFIDERNNCKQDYIAGATENGIQWHDLRKDPNDLPKQSAIYCDVSEWVIGVTKSENSEYVSMHLRYNFIKDVWGCLENPCVTNVVVWCEIPQFKEITE